MSGDDEKSLHEISVFAEQTEGWTALFTYTREKTSGAKSCQNSAQDQTNRCRCSTANKTAEFENGKR